MPTTETESTVAVRNPRDDVNAQHINQMLLGAINDAAAAGVFQKLALCHNTRRMLWEGQEPDGLLPALDKVGRERQKRVFTWEGAPDVRVPLADEIVVEEAMIGESVWNRGEIRLGPRETETADGVSDEEKAASWQAAMDFWFDVAREKIGYEFGLFRNCVAEYGYGLIHPWCRKLVRTDRRMVSLEQVLGVLVNELVENAMASASLTTDGAEGGDGSARGLPADDGGVLTPEMLGVIQENAQVMLEGMLLEKPYGRLQELLMVFDPSMPKSEARLAARELVGNAAEKAEGDAPWSNRDIVATYYAPQDDGYIPTITALVPFINCIHGTELKGNGEAWWFAMPERLCEADVRVRAATEDWEEEFLDKVLSHSNEFLISEASAEGRKVPQWALSGVGVNQVLSLASDHAQAEKFYEVVYVFQVLPDREGRTMVYHTLVQPRVNECVGFHECCGVGSLPLHVETREKALYAVHSRGIPEIVLAAQALIKTLMDAEGARAQLASNPPLERGSGEHKDITPGVQLFRKKSGDQGSQFLTVPQADVGASNLRLETRDMMNHRFFRHKETDPDMKRLYRDGIALAAVGSIRAVVRLLWKVMQGKVDTLKVSRLAGKPVDLEVTRDSMQGEVDVVVSFDVDMLTKDSADNFMGLLEKLAAADRGGAIDWTEVINWLMRMKNPDMARRVLVPREQAAMRVVDDENSRIAQMAAGVTLGYEEKATAPQMRLEVLQQWMQDPVNVARMQGDPAFGEKMQNEMVYLQRQIQQYQVNARTGRTLMPAA